MPNLVTALAQALANAGKAMALSNQVLSSPALSNQVLSNPALSSPASPDPVPPEPAPAAGPAVALPDDILLNALRNSLTGRDLIMQRRIGFGHEEQG